MSFSSRVAAIRQRSSQKSQFIFFVFFGLILFKLRRVCFFEFKMHAATAHAAVANKEMRVSPLYYYRGQQVAHSAGLWDAECIIFNRGRRVASWTLYG